MRNDALSKRVQGSCSRRVTSAGSLLLAMGFLLLTGCATVGKAKVEPAQPKPTATAAQPPTGPSVVHFTNGREGFVIREPAAMEAQLRAEFDRANAMIKDAKYDQAIETLEKVIGQAPNLTAPRINVAIAYGQTNKPEQAEQHLKKALETIPGHPLASNEYGLLLRKAGRFTESKQVYEKSLAAFPEYHPIHRNLAILCDLYLKDLTCAAEQYELYAQAMPKDQQVKLWLADLATRSGKSLTAAVDMQGALPMPIH